MNKLIQNKKLCTIIIILIAVFIMAYTNHEKTFLGDNQITKNLIWNSEYLVYDAISMNYQPGYESAYGLGTMTPYNHADYDTALTDETRGFRHGYSLTDTVIAIADNEATRSVYSEGNTLIFEGGARAPILDAQPTEDGYLLITYQSDEIFSAGTQGSLKYLSVYNEEKQTYRVVGQMVPYESQIGLQGMIFSTFSKDSTLAQSIEVYRWILVFLYAIVIVGICFQIYKKYNFLFGAIFYVVTLLAPWMIGYSTNLYWVEFTWFLPMLLGLICANHLESRKVRVTTYFFMMLAVFLKSACGYEYITTIMLSGIVVLLTDFTVAIIQRKPKKEIMHLFKVIFCMGVFALLGFVIAIVVHGYIRGDGNIYGGLREIYYNDVLRRTIGGDANMFQDVYADSLNSNVIVVVLRYLLFDTPIVAGVPGGLFIPLIAISFIGLVIAVKKDAIKIDILVLYLWMGVASVSWFVLGKSHSYIHTFMNFVMWYFGYVQIMFYSIIQIGKYIIGRKNVKMLEE